MRGIVPVVIYAGMTDICLVLHNGMLINEGATTCGHVSEHFNAASVPVPLHIRARGRCPSGRGVAAVPLSAASS